MLFTTGPTGRTFRVSRASPPHRGWADVPCVPRCHAPPCAVSDCPRCATTWQSWVSCCAGHWSFWIWSFVCTCWFVCVVVVLWLVMGVCFVFWCLCRFLCFQFVASHGFIFRWSLGRKTEYNLGVYSSFTNAFLNRLQKTWHQCGHYWRDRELRLKIASIEFGSTPPYRTRTSSFLDLSGTGTSTLSCISPFLQENGNSHILAPGPYKKLVKEHNPFSMLCQTVDVQHEVRNIACDMDCPSKTFPAWLAGSWSCVDVPG